MNYSDLEDKELYDQIEKANLAERFLNSPEGKLIQEAAKRIVDRAVAKFALQTKAEDIREIIELQTIIRKYRFGLFDEMKFLKEEGESAIDELEERDLLRQDEPINRLTGTNP